MKADIAIVGGGLAGLLLARHLRRQLPALELVVIERSALPREARDLRLGESTSEAGAWYLEHRLGLGEHLAQQQLAKLGLRFFFADPHGRGLGARPELGNMTPGAGFWEIPFKGTHPGTWQLHRGRLERHLALELMEQGVTLLDNTQLVSLDEGRPHTLQLSASAGTRQLQADWVVDSSGAGVLDNHLGPREPLDHRFRATWFWVADRLDPERWTSSPDFHSRMPADMRWRSTNHLCGPGYWVWLIPLASGHTSVGIVSDPTLPSPQADPVGWLRQREPELAEALEGPSPNARTRLVQASSARSFVSDRRLARVGDATGFIDPLYSGAIDMMALCNELLVGIIAQDTADAPIARRCRFANVLRGRMVQQFLPIYQGLYGGLLGNPRVLCAKVAWDNALYFSSLALWWRSGQLGDPSTMTLLGDSAMRVARLQGRVQAMLRDWSRVERGDDATGHVDFAASRFLINGVRSLQPMHQGKALALASREGVQRLETLALCLFERAALGAGVSLPEGPLNPYAVGLNPSRWTEDGLTAGRACQTVGEGFRQDVAPIWLDP